VIRSKYSLLLLRVSNDYRNIVRNAQPNDPRHIVPSDAVSYELATYQVICIVAVYIVRLGLAAPPLSAVNVLPSRELDCNRFAFDLALNP